MWFEPGELSKTKTTPLATCATPATFEGEYTKTAAQSRKVAQVAQVAEPLDSEIIIDRLLSAVDQQKILDWLAYIEEDDREKISETLDRCRSDAETLAYFLRRADETNNLIKQEPNR